jgi:hypothetical protein
LNRLNIVGVLMVAWMAAGCSSSGAYAGSEDITYGSWSGTFTPTGAETIDISYLVKREAARQSGWAAFGNTGQILLPASGDAGGDQKVEMTGMEWDGTALHYSWTDPQGTQLSCELAKKTDTLLSGDCVDSSGGTMAQMTMSPPAGLLDGS